MKKLLLFIGMVIVFVSIGQNVFAATPKNSSSTKTTKSSSFNNLQKIFYYIPGAASFASLQMYQDKIDFLAPQSYTIDVNGILTGKISDKVTSITTTKQIKIIPLVSNANFSQGLMTTILASSELQNKVIDQLVTEAQAKGYTGWQFDFERMAATDRDNYSSFVERAAEKFKAHNLHLSVAVITRTSENPDDLPEGSWDNWAGVYDYARIGKAADSVTLMAYDMPDSTGPVADIRWVEKVIRYTKKFIPPSKISLGIPSYAWIWDVDLNTRIKSVGDGKVQELLVNNLYTAKGYDKDAQTGWITYTENGVDYKIWYENNQSFTAKVQLVKKYKLQGFSVWALGLEDDAIWNNFKDIHTLVFNKQ
jgi:spore germination protein YaaH